MTQYTQQAFYFLTDVHDVQLWLYQEQQEANARNIMQISQDSAATLKMIASFTLVIDFFSTTAI